MYVEKEVIVEVPVPIYMNQKDQKNDKVGNYLLDNMSNCLDANSIAYGGESISLDFEGKSLRGEPPKDSLKLDKLIPSLKM